MNFIYKWRWELAAPLAGVCATLAFAPFDYAFLMVLSLFFVFLSWLECTPARAALRGFFYGLGLFGSGISWVYISVHDYGGAPALGAALLTLLIVLFWSLFPALTAYLAIRVFATKQPKKAIWVIPFMWVGLLMAFPGYK